MIPKVLSIHDMSCNGRASLTVILPILAACGVQGVPLPTAIFSSHLAFPHVKSVNFTPYMKEFMDMWDQNHIHFDAIYSGYLASPEQITVVEEAIRRYGKEAALVVVDPAMADRGKLYSGYHEDMVEAMRKLVCHADLIKPNYTEAAFLTGRTCEEGHIPDEDEITTLIKELSLMAPEVVITSIPASDGKFLNISFDRETGEKREMLYPSIPMATYGTGDIFSAILTAARLRHIPLSRAMELATVFLLEVTASTWRSGADPLEGMLFEPRLPELSRKIKEETSIE
jgi:pyridoxine kinase